MNLRFLPINRTKVILFAMICLLIAGYAALATMTNTDLTVGRFTLFMDERITFDGGGYLLWSTRVKAEKSLSKLSI